MCSVKRIYYPRESCDFLTEDWCRSHKRNVPVSERTVPKGIVLPPFQVPNPFGGFYSETGVLDGNGILIEDSGMLAGVATGVPPAVENPEVRSETVIFCGLLYFHYGHFLIQSTTRLYYALQNSDFPLVWAVSHIPAELPSYMKEFFRLCDIPLSRLQLIDHPVRYKEVILPDISSRYFQDWTPEFLLPFRKAAENIPPAPAEKIYFSRKKWTGVAKCYGEESLEELFVRNGFTPVMLEKLSLSQQIACIKGAKVLAGINGTAFHNILFGDSGKKLIFLNRNAEYDSQFVMNDACRADWYVIKVHENPLPVNHPHGPFIVGVTKELKDFCREHGLRSFNISFRPGKFLKSFLKRYMHVYAIKNCSLEFAGRYHNQLPADVLNHLYMQANHGGKRYLIYYILGRLLPGKMGEYFRVLYVAAKDSFSQKTEWKY